MSVHQIITGETGCGKTYKAINDEKNLNHRFIYIAPCRQLVYETYRYYANPLEDSLSTGELKLNMNTGGNFFGVFESVTPESVSEYDTIIVDEAHFINDSERGGVIANILSAAMEADINIKLVTATQTFNVSGFENIVLDTKFSCPKKVEITYRQAMENIDKGMQTIWFCGTIRETESKRNWLAHRGIKAIAMNSLMSPTERIKAQIAFEHKEVQVICCTNILAQGVNFECQNLIIDRDLYETNTQLHQKLGRLGRPGTLEGKNEVYYCTYDKPHKIKNKKDIDKFDKTEVDKSHIRSALNKCIYRLNSVYGLSYSDIRYCIPEFKEFAEEFLAHEPHWYDAKEDISKEIRDKESLLKELRKFKSITKDNALIRHIGKKTAMKNINKWLNGSDIYNDLDTWYGVFDLSDTLDKVTYVLTTGDLNYYRDRDKILSNTKHELTLIVLDKIDSPDGQQFIQNKIDELLDNISRLNTEEYLNHIIEEYSSNEYRVKSYKRRSDNARMALNMINKEQDKLKDIIIANMRKPPEL